ncbi:hypothetical protein GCM10018773_35510 [Streptomyces candidus]|nr:hypothetical protein GCM10018773_35510 [Streptomyces candidus]
MSAPHTRGNRRRTPSRRDPQSGNRLSRPIGTWARSGTPRTTRRWKTGDFEVRDAVEWELVTDDFLSDTGS